MGDAALAAVILVGALGVIATGVTVWAVRRSPVLINAREVAVLRGLFVASYVGVGLYTWRRRPASRLGPLFIGVGLFYSLVSLNASGEQLPYTIGRVLLAIFLVYLVYVAVIFPADRLTASSARQFMIAFCLASAATWALALAFSDRLPYGGAFADCASRCPHNPLALVNSSDGLVRTIDGLANAVTMAGLVWAVVLLVRKIRSPSRVHRRAVTPLLIAFAGLAASYVVYQLLHSTDATALKEAVRVVAAACALAVPFALLGGQIRGRAFAIASLGRILARAGERPVTPPQVQALIRDALGDGTVALALTSSDGAGYVDVDGAGLELPSDRYRRIVPLVRGGRTVAAVIYDPEAVDDRAVAESLATSSLMLLENSRLVEELQASRGRLAAVAGQERALLERDLHDGAQQQLTAIQIRLSGLLERVHQPDLAADLERVARDAEIAVDQLRRLARGIHPRLLEVSGLATALRAIARDTPISVIVDDRGIGRCPSEIEAAVYFCTLEALQNATKHAGPEAKVTITLERGPRDMTFSVVDDGPGFEPDTRSSGLGMSNMHDRIDAVGGELNVISSPGCGTTIRGIVPLACEQ